MLSMKEEELRGLKSKRNKMSSMEKSMLIKSQQQINCCLRQQKTITTFSATENFFSARMREWLQVPASKM